MRTGRRRSRFVDGVYDLVFICDTLDPLQTGFTGLFSTLPPAVAADPEVT